MFKDTKCSFNTILVVRNILPEIVLKDDEVDKYLSDHLIKALVHVLMEDYFTETHNEAAMALTTLYCALRSKNDYPARAMMTYLSNVTSHDVANFESSLINSKSLRHQRSALLELIKVNKNPNSIENGDEMSKRKKQLEEAINNRKSQLVLMS